MTTRDHQLITFVMLDRPFLLSNHTPTHQIPSRATPVLNSKQYKAAWNTKQNLITNMQPFYIAFQVLRVLLVKKLKIPGVFPRIFHCYYSVVKSKSSIYFQNTILHFLSFHWFIETVAISLLLFLINCLLEKHFKKGYIFLCFLL